MINKNKVKDAINIEKRKHITFNNDNYKRGKGRIHNARKL